MIRKAFSFLFQTDSPYKTPQAQIDSLHSYEYFQDLRRSRSLVSVPKMYDKLDETGVFRAEFLDLILQTNKATVPITLVAEDKRRPTLLSFGIFYQDNVDYSKLYLISHAVIDTPEVKEKKKFSFTTDISPDKQHFYEERVSQLLA